jgi:hypothetical protein
MNNATTFITLRRKEDARRVTKRLRDHGIIAGMRSSRGCNDVFGFLPPKHTQAQIEALALKIFEEKRA